MPVIGGDMTEQANEHRACVEAWLARTVELPIDRLPATFAAALNAVWRRAHRTLGEVTLAAIIERVLTTTGDGRPAVQLLEMGPDGLRVEGLRAPARELSRDELIDAAREVLVGLLTVLGSLTAEILTPALHAELANADPRSTKANEP